MTAGQIAAHSVFFSFGTLDVAGVGRLVQIAVLDRVRSSDHPLNLA